MSFVLSLLRIQSSDGSYSEHRLLRHVRPDSSDCDNKHLGQPVDMTGYFPLTDLGDRMLIHRRDVVSHDVNNVLGIRLLGVTIEMRVGLIVKALKAVGDDIRIFGVLLFGFKTQLDTADHVLIVVCHFVTPIEVKTLSSTVELVPDDGGGLDRVPAKDFDSRPFADNLDVVRLRCDAICDSAVEERTLVSDMC